MVADNTFERASGLKETDDLGRLDGMLFVYERPTSARFYMLDTLIPLDIWWFDGEGLLVGTTEMEPCPSEPCTRYASPGPVSWALETEMGVHEFAMGSQLSTVETS